MTIKNTAEISGRSWRTQEQRRSQAEDALLTSAAELFADRGISATSVAAICEHAGYSHGLINHHFGSKTALVERLARRCQESFTAKLHPERLETGIEAILHFAMAYIDAASPGDVFSRCFLVMWGAAFVSVSDDTFEQADQRSRDRIASWVKQGKQDGSIAAVVDGDAFAAVLLAMVRGICAQMVVSPQRLDAEKAKTEVSRVIQLALTGTEVS